MANTTVKGKFNVVAENGDVQTIYPKTTGDQVLVNRSSNASVIPNDVANLQHIVNKMGSLALKSKVETSDFTTGTMINSIADLKSNTETGKIADATVVKDIESRVDTLENSNLVTVDELDAGLATKPDTEINDSVTSTSLTWSSKKLSDQLTTLNSNTSILTNRVNTIIELPDGATTNDARLEDIRNGYDGTKYDSPGDAVRGQIEKTKSNIDAHLEFINSRLGFSDAVVENSEFIQGAYVDSDGYRSDGTYANMRTHNKLLPLSNYIVHLSSYPENMLVSIGLFSDGNGTWLRLYPTLVPITNGEYIIDTEDILTHFPGATHIRVNILSYADNTYYDISDVKINVYNQQGQTIIDQVEDLSESLNDYGENLDSQNVRLQKLESNKFILPLFNRGYKSINIIGDSISQGAVASSIPNNSYCGILRKMFSAELGGRLNYGFSAFDKSTDLGFDSSTVTWVYGSPMYGWQRNFADSSVLGGDSYTSSATNSRFCFKLWKNSHYLQIAIVGGSDKGCFELQNENGNVIAEIDCSTYPQGACLTDKIDISEIDASNGYEFLIVTKSADTVIISGVSLSDNDDYWTFNNYGRAGASPSVFTGDIFDKESRCSVLVYALGVNSGIDNLNNALTSIKNTAKSLNAQKIVLCLCFKGNGFDNRSGGKPQALKAFSDDIGALFIDVYEHCPKDSNGYIADGILSSDNIHPTDEGHRFIAELIAKNIGLSCNSGDDSTCNSELIDIRTGADGTLFSTAGSAVRGQISNANHQIDKLNSLSENFLALGVVPWTIRKHGYFRYDTGEFYDVTRYETGYATLYGASGQRFLYRGRGTGSAASVLYYDSNDNYLGGEQYNENYYHEITVPTTIDNKNVNKVIFASCYDTSNTSYLTFEIYKFTNIIGKLYDRDSNLQSELNTEKTFTSNLSQQVNGLTTSVSDYDVAVKTMMGAVPYTNSKLNGYYKYDKDNNTVTFLNANSFASGYVTVDVNEGDIFLYRGRGVGNAVSVVFYNANDEIVETMQFDETKFHEITIPSGVKKAFFTSNRNKNTTKKLTFDLYTPGTIKTLIDNQPSVSSSMTLNTANRLYASMTLGQAKHINNLDRAVVCIGFDDYNLDCLEGVQYLNSQNLKSYLALIPDNVTDNWNMAHVCYDNGGEIAAHSRTTLTSENQTFELMNEKFIQIPTIIGQHGFPVYGIIRAGGDNAGTENRSLDEFYCRAAGLKYSDYYGTVNPYRLTRENMTHKTLAEWQSYFDDLADRKGYAILYCHHLNGTEKNAYTNGFTLLDFKNLVSEIQNRDIDVMTINEFVDKYIYGITGTDAFIR